MGILGEILKHPDELIPLLKLKMSLGKKKMKIPRESPWDFCYYMLRNFSTGLTIAIQQLDTELRNATCIFYLVLRALDTIEDDTSIPTDIKVPILIGFHKHIYDPNWHFSCGTEDYKLLMDQFHNVSTIFCQLEKGYREVIEDVTKLVGVGMAKFIDKEIESIDDCDEYCRDTAGYISVGLSKMFHESGLVDQVPYHLSNSVGMFVQKTNIIRDYLEDINEVPKPRMFWPREIWSKYVNKLEDLKYEENSENAVKCLNDMVTNALMHTEDCMRLMSSLRDRAIFRFLVIPQIVAIGTLALCYNNVHVFEGVIKMRRGLIAKIVDRTNTMADVYGAFFDFSCMLKAKIDKNDPNASITLSRIEKIQKICKDSGSISKRKLYILRSEPRHNSIMMMIIVFIILAFLLARHLSTDGPYN